MVFQLLSLQEDLNTSPTFNGRKIAQLTVGDLHANAIKLLHTLVQFGVCDFKPVPYKKLLKLYTKPNPTIEDKKAFLKLIKNELKLRDRTILVRLIGDIVADRGKNDLYVLAILDILREQNVPVTTLISNHDIELILAYEAYKKTGILRVPEGGIIPEQKSSLAALVDSVGDDGLISNQEFERLMEQTYLPTLKLVDYSLSDTEPQKITIFSHAPIDLEVISYMARKFDVVYHAKTVDELATTINAINQKFVSYVRDGKLGMIYDGSKLPSDYHVAKANCIECAIWNRKEELNAGSSVIPADRVHFVYGHTMGETHTRTNVSKIDNIFGKSDLTWNELNPVFISDEAHPVIHYEKLPPAKYFSKQIIDENKVYWRQEKETILERCDRVRAEMKKSSGRFRKVLGECYEHLLHRLESYNELLILHFPSAEEDDLNRVHEILQLARTERFGGVVKHVIQRSLDALKIYSAGTAVSQKIKSIQEHLDKKQFQVVIEQLQSLSKNSFEGLGEHAIDASERGVFEKAWYNIIAGIRFLLSCVTFLFIKDADHGNSLAKALFGRPFFFQKPTTKGERELIEEALSDLEKSESILIQATGHSDTFKL